MELYQRLLYQIRMGYVDPSKQTAHQSIRYYPEEHLYDHDLSVQSIGRNYEIKRLRDLFPIEPYLNLPIEVSDKLIQGMMMGVEERAQMEQDAAAEKDREKQLKTQQTGESFNNLHNKS